MYLPLVEFPLVHRVESMGRIDAVWHKSASVAGQSKLQISQSPWDDLCWLT